MSRKSVLLGVAILVVLVGGSSAVLAALLRHERHFYLRMAVPPGPEREREAQAFWGTLGNIGAEIANRDEWTEVFTERQINSFFAEDENNVTAQYLPQGISEPRVALENDRIRLGFRYGQKPWSTVVSIDLRVWLAKAEPNVVAVEIQGLHAGGLSLSAQSLLERVFEVAKRHDIQVTWYHYNGNPVALLHFQPGQPRPTVKLDRLELHEGSIILGGRAADSSSLRAMLLPNLQPVTE